MPSVSFEFYPPKSLEASFRLWDCVQVLAPLSPTFVSVTYGAGGTTRKLTHDAVATLHKRTDLRVAAHLTCVDASKNETLEIAQGYADAGITDIVALRGDAPKGATQFTPHPQGFASSIELIEALSDAGTFNISVGAYPELHPQADSMSGHIDYLKRKLEAGASQAITQFFFESETYLRFRDACDAAGIAEQIVPGILPVENWKGVQKFATSCGASIPPLVKEAFDKAERDDRSDLLATAFATELCDDLMNEGVEHFHFYTLNRPELTRDVCRALGIQSKVNLENVA